MYLVEIKLGEDKIKKYVLNSEMLERLIKENPQYEYVKIIEELKSNSKIRKKKKWEIMLGKSIGFTPCIKAIHFCVKAHEKKFVNKWT